MVIGRTAPKRKEVIYTLDLYVNGSCHNLLRAYLYLFNGISSNLKTVKIK